MADKRLTELKTIPLLEDADLVYVVDTSDTTDHATGSSCKITKANLLTGVIPSTPPTGHYAVTNLYVSSVTGRLVVEYDDTPAS